ncbi:D-serine/D-alanine/glycine transporter [Lentilactobacillus parabuchneri]|jgi:AAT family amino acid transporter|uniref:Amino acid permease n=2 Tax=Lentilactobacillus parabuchneri TaxID=152331 RepID=A0A1X1FGQ1_9LACO|nr:amino acid permease [Lentilactobacillus parabuchneri]APR06790.1 D-serine/D-alanine/glycine transporter [Lentilactobacillus parabuchneri]KRM46873.1 amino acid permease-associated protein [Lentilactobacillus parabuchneri DSM 5707 = NBRC 107865]KRN76607.1 amino acid permease-associated protein [Lentilactobacillus parabuchneri]MBW0222596.1 amino acid permease [Lentilactobacillus parabuchneri]MBW0245816.1 amino acid permease [Lentilactobacillus parabuchneri]
MQKTEVTKNADGTRRSLSNRNVQMIAIGGTIGTGLFLGSGTTISKTGPSILLVYLVLGIFFFLMMRALGEMLYSDPSQHTFVAFITRYLGPTVGHFTGWTYWLGLSFCAMAEITAISTYVQFWFPTIPSWIIQLVFLGTLAGVNLIAAKLFGEAEFWFALIKIVAILALIATGAFMMFSHSVTPLGHASIQNISQNFSMFPHGAMSFISAFPMVFFAFQGIEFVSITIGEAQTPHKIIKKAVNETLLKILIFYFGALIVIMGIIPWTHLNAASSPFVQVFKLAGFPAAAAIINFVVLTSASSSLNSFIFSAGRHFYQLATETPEDSFMHRHFAKISKNGVPVAAITMSAFCLLITPLMSLTNATASVFTIVAGSSNDMYILVYALAMIAHRKYRQSSDFLPNGFKMPWYNITSPLTIAFFAIIFVTLFFIPQDIIGAVGAIIWTIVFGGVTYMHQRSMAVANPEND